MKIYIVSAAYNERDNIKELITILEEEVFPEIKEHEMHILIADDNSPDGTGDVVRELMGKYKNLDINQGEKKGLGAAYVRAMGYAVEHEKADVVISIDADLQHDPRAVPSFIKKMEEGYDVVSGTRYSDGGSMPAKWPIQRKLFSVTANILMRVITGRFYLHDWTGGYRAIKKEVFIKEKEKVREYKGYTFQVAFLYKTILDGFKAGEVPIHFRTRRVGDSKIAPLAYIVNVLKYVITERIRELITGPFGKFIIVGGFGFLLNAIILRLLVDRFHWVPYYANLIGAVVAIFSNYNLNNLWTFRHHKATSFWKYIIKMLQFYLTSAFGVIVIQTGTIFVGVHFITQQKDYFIYFIGGTAILLVWNFFVYSKFIWRKK
jgi:dolichol-phosphate mannosyltransferase